MVTYRVGRHHFYVADLEDDDVTGILRMWAPDVIYTDLPYDPRIARTFRKWVGDDRPVDFEHLLLLAWRATLYQPEPVICFEIGRKWADYCENVARSIYGWRSVHTFETTYNRGKGKACVVTVGWYGRDLAGMDSWDLPGAAVADASEEGGVVSDLCTGLGLTAREAAKQGRVFVGTELNEDRMFRAATSVSKLVKQPVWMEGNDAS